MQNLQDTLIDPIYLTPLVNAQQTNCKHVYSLSTAIEVFGEMKNGKCEKHTICAICRTEVEKYESVPLIQNIVDQVFGLSAKNTIRERLVNNAREEQKSLLECVSDKELEDIESMFDHPKQGELVSYIQLGEWDKLIEMYQSERSFPIHTLLKATYCQEKITIDELATSYIFLAPAVSNFPYTIHRFDLHSNAWGDLNIRWWDMTTIPINQRYFITINKRDLFRFGREEEIMEYCFSTIRRRMEPVGGMVHENKLMYGMTSAALIKSDRRSKNLPPVFVRGLDQNNPTSVFQHLLEKHSYFGLIDPSEMGNNNLFGARPISLLPYAYDGLVLNRRDGLEIINYKECLHFGIKLQKLINSLPAYSQGAIIAERATLNPAIANNHDKVKYMLEHVIHLILDEARVGDGSINDCFGGTIRSSVHQLFQSEGFTYDQIFECLPLLNQRLRTFGIQLARQGYGLNVIPLT